MTLCDHPGWVLTGHEASALPTGTLELEPQAVKSYVQLSRGRAFAGNACMVFSNSRLHLTDSPAELSVQDPSARVPSR